jgi:ASC-1-like (ASCH) protein
MVHQLKILPNHYEAVLSGKKKAEIRLNDRKFKVNDLLILKEWESDGGYIDSPFIRAKVTHILSDEKYLRKGYVCLSIEV